MVTGIPPRHSRSGGSPVEIDLVAEPVEPGGDAISPAESDTEALDASTADEDVAPAGREDIREESEDVSHVSAIKPDRRPGGLGAVTAGIIGGVIALLGAAGLQYAGVLQSLTQDRSTSEMQSQLSTEIAALNQRIDQLPAPQAVGLAGLDARFAAIDKKIAALPATGGGESSDANARLAALGDQLTALKTGLDQQTDDDAKARAALQMRLEAVEKKANEPRDDLEVGRAIASAGLKAAIDRGGPFLSELETLAGITPDDPAIAELKPFAATGVPSRADLAAAYANIATAVLNAQNAAGPIQGFWDRLSTSAMSIVKVRPVGNIEGEGVDAIVARMETKLQNGDLKGVALEWTSLPDVGKAASRDFKAKLDARITVEDLVGSTLTRAVRETVN